MPLSSAGAFDLPEILMVVGAAVVAFTLGRLAWRRRAADADPAFGEEHGQVRRLREKTDQMISEIEAMGRETIARAETRIRVLNELLVRANSSASRTSPDAERVDASRLDEVHRLAREGLGPAGIAERTGFEPGEIELILSLRGAASVPDADRSTETDAKP
jgi:hypothetical protein